MLKKIIAIKNVGRFRNSAAAGNPQLAKHTFIAGANGFGKTTLCAVLRSLQTGDAAHVIGRKSLGVTDDIAVELLFDNGAIRFDGAVWSATRPAIAIFDGVFVAENVHAGEVVEINQRRNLYRVIIGDSGVSLAEQDAALAAESRAKTTEISTAAKALTTHIPTGMKLEAFLALPAAADIDAQIAEQQRIVESARQAGAIRDRAPLSEYSVPALPEGFNDILAQTIDDIAADAESLIVAHLAAHGMAAEGGNWIAEGIDQTSDTCPFCGQDVQGLPLIAAYRAMFSQRYKQLQADIDAMKAKAVQHFGDGAIARLDTTAARNKADAEFWNKYIVIDIAQFALPGDAVIAFRNLGAAALALLDAKANAPLGPVTAGAEFAVASAKHGEIATSIMPINTAILAANLLIAAKKTGTGAADIQAAEAEIARRGAVKSRHSAAVSALCTAYTALVAAKEQIDTRKEAIRASLDAHTKAVVKPYERRINDFLGAFNAGFTIAETKHGYTGGTASSSYQLVINNTAIDVGDGKTPTAQPSFKNTLSSGDRTTLALAFFLANLERDPAAASKIVVLDDPFNSQDAFRRRQTVHEILKIASRCAQVVVLSHDATFLKQVWDKAPAADRVALTIADHRAQGSKLLPVDLERACQGRTASDTDDLQTYLVFGAGALIDIIRKMRVVLETYCRTTYPSSFLASDWLGDMVRKIREGGEAHPTYALYDELDQINGYTCQYHHGEDVADSTPDQIDGAELTGFTRRTLKIVNALQA